MCFQLWYFTEISNINEAIRPVLNFFFYKKIPQVQKSTKPLTASKNTKMCIKNI